MINRKITHAYNEFIIKSVKMELVNDINVYEIKGAMKGDFDPRVQQ